MSKPPKDLRREDYRPRREPVDALQYDNTASPFYSETERKFATAQDWTDHGPAPWCCTSEAMHRASRRPLGQIIMNAIGVDIWDTADQFRYVYRNLSGNGSMWSASMPWFAATAGPRRAS